MIFARRKLLLLSFLGAVLFAGAALVLVFGGVFSIMRPQSYSISDFGPAQITYRTADFSNLPGWRTDDPMPALSAFLRSCEAMEDKDNALPANPQENHNLLEAGISFGGVVADWRDPCAQAHIVDRQVHSNPAARRSAIRAFFEYHFIPLQIISRRLPLPDGPARRAGPAVDETGIFTGYFEPVYDASRFRNERHQSPLYPRPTDLVEVDLGKFKDELRGERIAGRVDTGNLVPYPDREAIDAGALEGRVSPIAWLEPNDLFFLQIQGSGRLAINAQSSVRVGYAAQNGQPYTAIGRIMVERGWLPLEEVSMQSIRRWLDQASPEDAQELRSQNQSYVFFRELSLIDEDLGPFGAQGAPLTPRRSLAVDRRFHTLGAPVWIDINAPPGLAGADRIRQLMIAQDTGGAIRGPIRGDFFWGPGDRAGAIAGAMNVRGKMYILTPRLIAERLPRQVLQ